MRVLERGQDLALPLERRTSRRAVVSDARSLRAAAARTRRRRARRGIPPPCLRDPAPRRSSRPHSPAWCRRQRVFWLLEERLTELPTERAPFDEQPVLVLCKLRSSCTASANSGFSAPMPATAASLSRSAARAPGEQPVLSRKRSNGWVSRSCLHSAASAFFSHARARPQSRSTRLRLKSPGSRRSPRGLIRQRTGIRRRPPAALPDPPSGRDRSTASTASTCSWPRLCPSSDSGSTAPPRFSRVLPRAVSTTI